MWNVKAKVIEGGGRLELFEDDCRRYLNIVQGKGEIKELTKATILCTAQKLREVLV
jgi:hypothetical protein